MSQVVQSDACVRDVGYTPARVTNWPFLLVGDQTVPIGHWGLHSNVSTCWSLSIGRYTLSFAMDCAEITSDPMLSPGKNMPEIANASAEPLPRFPCLGLYACGMRAQATHPSITRVSRTALKIPLDANMNESVLHSFFVFLLSAIVFNGSVYIKIFSVQIAQSSRLLTLRFTATGPVDKIWWTVSVTACQ
jgi:hypothetical protein